MTRENDIYTTTLVGSVANVALTTFKFIAGILGGSAAMMADAVHSLSDFVTDLVVLAFVHVSAKPQDKSHDYGHGKFETLATFIIGLALVAAATGIIVSGALRLIDCMQGAPLRLPGRLALWAALVSILVKELLYHYTRNRGKALRSQALVANAWHHRSDALSSVAAAVGIGGALLLGEQWAVLDPVASVVVGLMLMKVSWDLLKPSVGELSEGSLSDEAEHEIEQIVSSVPGVSEPHNQRTRRIGNRVAIEAHIRLDGDMPLREAHEAASAIERQLKARFGHDALITIHMEPRKEG
jgi:cation diffusion facilitator family transporter